MSGPPDMGIRIRDHSVRPQPTVVVKTASNVVLTVPAPLTQGLTLYHSRLKAIDALLTELYFFLAPVPIDSLQSISQSIVHSNYTLTYYTDPLTFRFSPSRLTQFQGKLCLGLGSTLLPEGGLHVPHP